MTKYRLFSESKIVKKPILTELTEAELDKKIEKLAKKQKAKLHEYEVSIGKCNLFDLATPLLQDYQEQCYFKVDIKK